MNLLKFLKISSFRKKLMFLIIGCFCCSNYDSQIYNVSYSQIKIGGSGVTITPKVGTGSSVNDIVLYQNVISVSGQAIDAVVTTMQLSNCTISTYDQTSTTGANTGNSVNYFSPQLTIGSGGGYAMFTIQFILSGSFNNTSNSGTNVTLSNVNLNTYDLDGNGSAGTNQYSEFGGFSSSELGSPTNVTTSYNSVTGLTKFRSNIATNTNDITDVKNRVRVTYDYLSLFSTKVGSEGSGAAYFFLDFSAGTSFTTAVTYAAPVLDLNTSTIGLDNSSVIVAPGSAMFDFGDANITYSGPTLDNLKISFTSSQIVDGSNELLLFSGASSGGPIPLNFSNAQSFANVLISGTSYSISAVVSGGTSILTFTKSGGGLMTLAEDEALLDAFQYSNTSNTATSATRVFVVTTLAGSFETAPAKYYLTITSSLPTELVNFSALENEGSVELNWEMASEYMVNNYLLEKSMDGTSWSHLATISSLGNSDQKVTYSSTDLYPINGFNYYRLTAVDNNDYKLVFDPIQFTFKEKNIEPIIYPNPTEDNFNVLIECNKGIQSGTISFMTTSGKIISSQEIVVHDGTNVISFNNLGLISGIYFVKTEIGQTSDLQQIVVR